MIYLPLANVIFFACGKKLRWGFEIRDSSTALRFAQNDSRAGGASGGRFQAADGKNPMTACAVVAQNGVLLFRVRICGALPLRPTRN